MIEKYKTYSVVNIIAFRNQQRLINDIYIPLSLTSQQRETDAGQKIESYTKEFLYTLCKVLITDTAGMGKSTLSRKLFLSVIETNAGIPIFIELRRLNSKHKILDEIMSELKLINEDVNKTLVLDLIRRGDFIFFLDGYDEIASVDKAVVTTDLQKFIESAWNNNFIITSRPEEALSSFGGFQEVNIKPLKKEEAYLLLKKYDNNGSLSKNLIEKLDKELYSVVSEFMTNPLLVSMLYTAYEYKQKIPLKKHIYYRQVYDALYEAHDLSKGDYFEREKYSKLDIDDFHTVMRYLAFGCLKQDKIEFTKDEIINLINSINRECDFIEFNNSDLLKDLITAIPLFRQDGLYYKWAHKSLYEYFLSQFLYLDTGNERSSLLKKMVQSENNMKFQNIIDIYSEIDYKSFIYEVVRLMLEEYRNFCNKTFLTCEVEMPIIRERQELIFNYEINILNIGKPKKERSLVKHIEDVLYKKELKTSVSIPSIAQVINNNDYVNYNVVIYRYKANIFDTIIGILKRKNDEILKQITITGKKNCKSVSLQQNKIFSANKDLNSLINAEENFCGINNLIQLYLEGIWILDYSKSMSALKNIEDQTSESSTPGFLNFDSV